MKYHKIPELGVIMGLQKQDLDWLQSGLAEGINGLLNILGSGNYIISGVIESGTQLTDGWIYYNKELLRFKGGAINTKFVIIDEEVVQGTDDYDKYARPGSNVGAIELSSLVRLDKLQELGTKIKDLQNQTNQIQEEIDAINDTLVANSEQIEENKDEIIALNNRVTANSGQIQLNINAIASHTHFSLYEPKYTALSKTNTGYLDLGNGLQLRWGSYVSDSDSTITVNFAKAFTNACFMVVTTDILPEYTIPKTKTGFSVNRSSSIVNGTVSRSYIAYGN